MHMIPIRTDGRTDTQAITVKLKEPFPGVISCAYDTPNIAAFGPWKLKCNMVLTLRLHWIFFLYQNLPSGTVSHVGINEGLRTVHFQPIISLEK